jgi:hypothetical protein
MLYLVPVPGAMQVQILAAEQLLDPRGKVGIPGHGKYCRLPLHVLTIHEKDPGTQ